MERSKLLGNFLFSLLIVLFFIGGCKKEKCNPIALVQEADEIIRTGGLENSDLRKKVNDLYNRALTCDDVKLEGADYEFVQSHAHFGIAMVSTFNTVALVNTLLGQMGGDTGGCSLSCGGAGGCGGAGCPSLCPSGGMSCSSCEGCSSGSCNITNIRSMGDIKKLRSQLFLAGFLNGLVYLSPFLFLFFFRIGRSIRRRRPDIPAVAIILVFAASLALTGLKPKQNEGECQPLELGNLKDFLEDAMTQIIGPITNDLAEVTKYKSFSMTLDSAKLTILQDNPFTTSVTDDPLYINLMGTYDYADVSFLLGTFQGVLGLVKIVFAYDIVDPLIAYISAPECSPNPLSIPGFGEAVATMSELEEIRNLLASSLGSFAGAFNYIINERGSQTNHLLNYEDTGIDVRADKDEFGYNAGDSNPNPVGDDSGGDGSRQAQEEAIQLVKIPSGYPLPTTVKTTLKVYTTPDTSVTISNALPVGETFYDWGIDGKVNTWDKDKTYAVHNVDGSGDGTGGAKCSTSNWCNLSASSCLPLCSTEGNGIYEDAATCGGGKPGETLIDKGTDNAWDSEEGGKYGVDGKPGVAGVDDDADGIIDNASEWKSVGVFGPDGQPGVAGVDDNGVNGTDDCGEYGWSGSDDQYNDRIDPSCDNVSSTDPLCQASCGGSTTGTEGNGAFDSGEPFQDVGCDGVQGIAPDFGEGDGIWELGAPGEPFNDFGIDGIPGTYDYGEADSYFEPYQELYFFEMSGQWIKITALPDFIIKQGASYYDSNGALHLASPPINWADVGADGKDDYHEVSSEEKGYEQVCNSDPKGDNYDPTSNPSGTEGNGTYNAGEPFLDWGTDTITVSGFVIGVPDFAEDGFAGADPNRDNYSDTNPSGTENNDKYDPGEKWQCSLTGYLLYIVLQVLPALGIDVSSILPINISGMDIDQAANVINIAVSPILSKAIYLDETAQLLTDVQTSILDDDGAHPVDTIKIVQALLKKFPGLITELGSLVPDISSVAQYNGVIGLAAHIPPLVFYNISAIMEQIGPLIGTLPPIAGIPSLDVGAMFRNPPTNITDLLPMFHKEDEPCNGDCSSIEYFADINGNGIRDPFEYYEDTNSNGQYDASTASFTDIDGSGRWNRAGDIMLQRTEIESWWDVGDPWKTNDPAGTDPAEGNGKFDRGEPFYDWGTDQLPDLYELSAWGPDGRPGVASQDDDWDGTVDEPDEYLSGYDCSDPNNCPIGPDWNDDLYDRSNSAIIQLEFGPDKKPGVAGVDDNSDGITDNFSEYLWPGSDDSSRMFGNDAKPGVANVDDDGINGTDDAGEYVYCINQRISNPNACAGMDDVRPPFGYDGLPGYGVVDDDGDGIPDNYSEYVYCQNFNCPGSDDNPDPAGDNYDASTNPTGTELNGIYNSGEKYLDYGLDREPGSGDDGENNGTYDAGDPFSNVGVDNKYDAYEPGYIAGYNPDPELDNMECLSGLCLYIYYPGTYDYRAERTLAISPKLYPYYDPAFGILTANDIFASTCEPIREATGGKDPKHPVDTDPLKTMKDKPHYWPVTGKYEAPNNLPDSVYLFFNPPLLGGMLTIPIYHNGANSFNLLTIGPPLNMPLILPPERGFECGTLTFNTDKMNNYYLNAMLSLLTGLISGEYTLDIGL